MTYDIAFPNIGIYIGTLRNNIYIPMIGRTIYVYGIIIALAMLVGFLSVTFIAKSKEQNVDDYYKYVMQNGEAVKLYNSANVYLLFDKETYEVSEYIYYRRNILGGLGSHVELYDLPNENMIVYSDGISTTYNEDYYKYIIENNYQVCLTEVSDYVEGHTGKEYYSLDEIKELEPQISESLKIINYAKVKTK